MRRHLLTALMAATAAMAASATLGFAATASASTSGPSGDRALPRHVFAPYFETYNTTDGSLADLSAQSGAKFMSLAFLQTAQPGSCTAFWDGDPTKPIAQSTFGADIA